MPFIRPRRAAAAPAFTGGSGRATESATECRMNGTRALIAMAALLDRLTHRCHIFEMNGESYRFRESVKAGKKTKAASTQKV